MKLPPSCPCGKPITTIGGFRKHAKSCELADEMLRRREDRERLDRVEQAKVANRG